MLTVVGLGIDDGDLTKKGEQAILDAVQTGAPVLVRTAHTRSYQTVVNLGIAHTCLDYIYEKSRNFRTLSKNLAKAVMQSGKDAVYLVDGSASEDNSVKALCQKTRGKINIIDGVSKVTALVRKAKLDGCSYTAVSAYELLERANSGDLALPLVVYDMDDKALASDCKLLLGDLYGEETQIRYLCGDKSVKIPLYEMDRQKSYDYSSAVVVESQPLLQKSRFSLADLREIIVRLRKPDGCPWDRVQTNESIKMSAVEEAYELVDAIDQADDSKILEETGDILLQVIFHAVLKEETGAFTLTDILTGICNKLITRHTHVFGKDKAENASGALSVWDENKRKEKGQVTYADAVNDVPKCFPAVMRAQKVGKRAGKAGMDFESVEQASERLQAELLEVFDAIKTGNSDEVEKEIGDLLFSAVNVGRKAGADCEKALKESVERFAKRFTVAEKLALTDGREVTKLTPKEWDEYYLQAKRELLD